jgi:hypothetical protein
MIVDIMIHPAEHKLAGVNYLVNRITSYLMAAIRKEREIRICQHILNSNGFHHINIADKMKEKAKKGPITYSTQKSQTQKWASFTYSGA